MTVKELKELDSKLEVPMFTSVLTEVEFPVLVDYIISLHGNKKMQFRGYVECKEIDKYVRLKRRKKKNSKICYFMHIFKDILFFLHKKFYTSCIQN